MVAASIVPAQAATGPAEQVFTLVNQQRAANGLSALVSDPTLDAAAQAWAQHLASNGIFEHSSSQWRASMISGAGWVNSGENIAAGQTNATSVMNGWMNSAGHRANILYPSYTGVGVGYVYAPGSPYGYYWVQIFATSSQPRVTAGNAPTISGTAALGQTLTATATGWPAAATLSWSWRANGTPIPGATAATYVPSISDTRRTITVTVTGTRPGHVSAALTSPPTAVVAGAPTVERVTGADRFDSAAGISRSGFEPGVPVAYVATGETFPDALSAAPAATLLGGPLLLTQGNALPTTIRTELVRLAPGRIVVVGGTASVSDSVLAALSEIAPTTRIAGADRYAASRAIVMDAFTTSDLIYIATGSNFPDALTSSAVAGSLRVPVLLVEGTSPTLTSDTLNVLRALNVTTVRIAGGVNSVSQGIQDQLSGLGLTVQRLSGADRYEAGNAVVAQVFTRSSTVYLTSGTTSPDALAGAALAGKNGSPMFLTTAACIPESVSKAIGLLKPTRIVILGGPNSVSESVAGLQRC